MLDPDGFIFKADKPVNTRQLWNSIKVKLPKLYNGILRKTEGTFFRVKEIDITRNAIKKENTIDPLDIEMFIKWENITYIESYNSKTAGEGNNNILIHTTSGNTGYIYRSTLTEMEKQLPNYFIRFDKATIVNFKHVTAKKGRGQTLYFIGDTPFKLSDSYKDDSLGKINILSGN